MGTDNMIDDITPTMLAGLQEMELKLERQE